MVWEGVEFNQEQLLYNTNKYDPDATQGYPGFYTNDQGNLFIRIRAL